MSKSDLIRQMELEAALKKQAAAAPRLPSMRRSMIEHIQGKYPVVLCEDIDSGILVRFNERHGVLSNETIIRLMPSGQESIDSSTAQSILDREPALMFVLQYAVQEMRRVDVYSKLRVYTFTPQESDRVGKHQDLDQGMYNDFSQLKTAAELHYCILFADVSDGLDECVEGALRNPALDRGTALNLFVNLNMIDWFEREEPNRSGYVIPELIELLFDRLNSGAYQTEIFRYLPQEHQLNDGVPDLSRFSREIPAWMFQPIAGQYDGVYDPVSRLFAIL